MGQHPTLRPDFYNRFTAYCERCLFWKRAKRCNPLTLLRSLYSLLVRQESSVVLMNCEVFIMVNGQKPCSQLCDRREQSYRSKPEAAKARAVVYRELDSASLNILESGQPSRRGEASTGSEALTKCKGRTLRGEWRQRAQTEPTGTWEARHCRSAARQQQPMGR
jgi:hypothetical protein